MSTTNKNVFISHHGKDDEHITKLKDLMRSKGYILRNSSIDSSKSNQATNDQYIQKLLREGIRWAGTTVVLIGHKTHTRDWVNWEIEQALKEGKRIVGVFIQGATDADVPDAFQKYGDALVGWNSDRIIDAIEGSCNNWNKTDGSPWENKWDPTRGTC
jgi:hypothetical protein